jgi:hypothetical protein
MNIRNRLKLMIIAIMAVPSIMYALPADVYCYSWVCGVPGAPGRDFADDKCDYTQYTYIGKLDLDPDNMNGALTSAKDACFNHSCAYRGDQFGASLQTGQCSCGGFVRFGPEVITASIKNPNGTITHSYGGGFYFDGNGKQNPHC